jgi:hypothetical protein
VREHLQVGKMLGTKASSQKRATRRAALGSVCNRDAAARDDTERWAAARLKGEGLTSGAGVRRAGCGRLAGEHRAALIAKRPARARDAQKLGARHNVGEAI